MKLEYEECLLRIQNQSKVTPRNSMQSEVAYDHAADAEHYNATFRN